MVAVAAAVTALPLTTALTVGASAPLAPPLGACSGPDCPATWPEPNNGDFTGRDAAINIFTGGNYTVNGRAAEAEGRIVTLGTLTLDKDGGGIYNMGVVGVGSRVVPPNGSDFVTTGQSIDVVYGNSLLIGGRDSTGPATGNLRHAGTTAGTISVDPAGESIEDANATSPYQDILARIKETSDCVGRATATGTVTVTSSEATFTGDGAGMKQVFNVNQNLTSPTGGQIGLAFTGIPAGATVVVNMLGDAPVVNTYTGTGLAGDPTTDMRSKLMYNFPTATTAQILGSAQFQGSILTGNPSGTTTIAQPGMNGRVYLAGNLIHTGTGGYEIHSYPFDGDLLGCTTPPSPIPTAPETTSPSPTPSSSESSTVPVPATPSSSETSTVPVPATPSASETSTAPVPATPSASETSTAPVSPTPTAAVSPTPTTPAPSGEPTIATGSPTAVTPTSHEDPSAAAGAPVDDQAGRPGELPHTGAGNQLALGLLGIALMGLGAVALVMAVAARRRAAAADDQTADEPDDRS